MFSKETYISRRIRLSQMMPNAFLLFVGNTEAPFNYSDNTYRFRQDSTFLYLFGLDEPNLCATIDTATGNTTLFADDVSMDDIIWTGPMPNAHERADKSGMTAARPLKDLQNVIAEAQKQKRTIHFVTPYRADTILQISLLTGIEPQAIKGNASKSLMQALVSLRSIKEPCEIEDMERQMKYGVAMHLRAMRMAKEGITENEIMSALAYEAHLGGGEISFPSICTTHGQTLHNHGYIHTLHQGDLLLVDAGCESPNHYATDNTRTSPVGGKFSNRQREIYQAVLDANDAARSKTAPGVLYRDVHLEAARCITESLKAIGLMKGDTEDAVATGAYALFMPHGIGHMLGLDVHDMDNYGEDLVGYDSEISRFSQFGLASLRLGRRLQPGFCVTDEPGIYFIPELIDRWAAEHKFEDFINYTRVSTYKDFGGIRIEDDILVTQEGCRIIGNRLPATINEVEATIC